MNQIVQQDPRLPIGQVGLSVGAGGTSIAPQNLGEVVKFAEVMARAGIALPKHLRGNPGACMAVALQALQWQMSPFQVAAKSYAVNDLIAYEAQLIAAVVNTRSGIKGRLRYEFFGEGQDLWCRVTGILEREEYAYQSPPIAAIKPQNSPLWKTDPRQQLGYYSARAWARRYTPEVILGVYDREEAEAIGPDAARDVTPSVLQRLQNRQQQPQDATQTREGFSRDFVMTETAALSSGQETGPSAQDESDGDRDLFGNADSGADASSQAADASEEGNREKVDASATSSSKIDPEAAKALTEAKQECKRVFSTLARNPDRLPVEDLCKVIKDARRRWNEELPTETAYVGRLASNAELVVTGQDKDGKARKMIEEAV